MAINVMLMYDISWWSSTHRLPSPVPLIASPPRPSTQSSITYHVNTASHRNAVLAIAVPPRCYLRTSLSWRRGALLITSRAVVPQMVPARPWGFHLSLEYSWVNFEYQKNALIVCFDTANVTKRRGNRVWGHGGGL